jgi:hypothetical protein
MTLDITTKNQAALELTGKIAANPALAGPILDILRQLSEDGENLKSLDLSALVTVLRALPKSQVSAEQPARTENLIQGNAAIHLFVSYAIQSHSDGVRSLDNTVLTVEKPPKTQEEINELTSALCEMVESRPGQQISLVSFKVLE